MPTPIEWANYFLQLDGDAIEWGVPEEASQDKNICMIFNSCAEVLKIMKPVYEAYKQAFNRLADMVEGIEKITDLKLPQLQGERVRFTATTNQTDKNSEDSTNNKSLPAIGV